MGVIVKCVVPGCKVVGEGIAGRPYACVKHTAWFTAGYRGLKAMASAAGVQAGKEIAKKVKMPWWAKAFVQGVRDER